MFTNDGNTHVMVDIETLGVTPGAAVLSIAAVVMDFESFGEPGQDTDDDFSIPGVYIDYPRLQDQVQAGLHLDPDTVLWWLGRTAYAGDAGSETQQAIVDGQQNQPPTYMTLAQFSEWLELVCDDDAEDGTLPVMIWGNGANFDAPLLRSMYQQFGMNCPWSFRNEACYRTMRRALSEYIEARDGALPSLPEQEGASHDAFADAMYQARYLTTLLSLVDQGGTNSTRDN